jgi:3-oxoacyl-[acyl-carrier-protein] synthase-3
MSAAISISTATWQDPREMTLLGMGSAVPGNSVATHELIDRLQRHFDIDVSRAGRTIAKRLGVRARHICRDLRERHECPRPEDTNVQLSARALSSALREANLSARDLGYLITHTATPGQLIPPNAARLADLIGYDGPFLELRQACTGFANALVVAQGLVSASQGKPIAIVGSETGSVFFDPHRVREDRGQLVNMLQMGDGAGACIVGAKRCDHGATISHIYFGQIGRNRAPAFSLSHGGSDAPHAHSMNAEFNHDFAAVRDHGPRLFEEGIASARHLGIELPVDYLVPHQANGRMADLLAPKLNLRPEQVFVNADRLGNTGSAAIWLALDELRAHMRRRERALILGAEATKFMFGGFLYVHN